MRARCILLGLSIAASSASAAPEPSVSLPDRPLLLRAGKFEGTMVVGLERLPRDDSDAAASFVDVGTHMRTTAGGLELNLAAAVGLYASTDNTIMPALETLDSVGFAVRRELAADLAIGAELGIRGPSSDITLYAPRVTAAYKAHVAPWAAISIGAEAGIDRGGMRSDMRVVGGELRAQLHPLKRIGIEGRAAGVRFYPQDGEGGPRGRGVVTLGLHALVEVTAELDAVLGCDAVAHGQDNLRCSVGFVVQSERPQLIAD
ncbi:MAG: hypothetical protein H0T46_24240 [Deltaproteobacteria bacterium]|nr:hypothetical protein [Deltaproteobacteria bacterium]